MEDQPITIEAARRVMEEEKAQRLQQCQHEINEALRRYSCDLVGVPRIVDGRIVAQVTLVEVSGKGSPQSP